MQQNVQPTTNTVGNIKDTRTLFSGQAQTRQYSDTEKPVMFKNRDNKQLGQNWDDPKIAGILAQDNQN
ncbi:hypothetical protein [Ligilactobacillus sp.]|uniref:hypothetical protein n=1 Tax=Ligilactobacillus sp. TaxID=2767921 RepID=UPI002FE34A2B